MERRERRSHKSRQHQATTHRLESRAVGMKRGGGGEGKERVEKMTRERGDGVRTERGEVGKESGGGQGMEDIAEREILVRGGDRVRMREKVVTGETGQEEIATEETERGGTVMADRRE